MALRAVAGGLRVAIDLFRVPVIPVIVIEDIEAAVPLARALAQGGLSIIEITLRSSPALEAIRRIRAEVEEVSVGAGTVTDAVQIEAAVAAGARFLVSPGTTADLAEAARDTTVPFLPGAATVSEMMALRDRGFTVLKFFPAEASGGATALRAIGGPLRDIEFVPTGGIDAGNAANYLELANVLAVGGSWVAPHDAIKAGNWSRITELARAAAALRPEHEGDGSS